MTFSASNKIPQPQVVGSIPQTNFYPMLCAYNTCFHAFIQSLAYLLTSHGWNVLLRLLNRALLPNVYLESDWIPFADRYCDAKVGSAVINIQFDSAAA